MNIHEYQAMELFRSYGIPVNAGRVACTPEEAVQAARELPAGPYVLKAQIHSGGRGKAGGVKVLSSLQEVESAAKEMLGSRLVTRQTGPQGKTVRKLLVCPCRETAHEYYLSMTLDASTGRVAVLSSAEGGMEIEQIAASMPDRIFRVSVDPAVGLKGYHGLALAKRLGLDAAQTAQLVSLLKAMYRLYWEKDCSLIEINPLAADSEGRLAALDAKINFDDNALYRHKDIAELRDPYEEDPREVEASKYGLNYIQLDGSIGCMVNGAGLAMATMDIIQAFGGSPSNFLDVGGGASAEKISGAFGILLSDPNVKGIFINIFGGIMRCDAVAEGVVSAARAFGVRVPVVVRLEGTNAEAGSEILKRSGLEIIPAAGMADGARRICEMTAGRKAVP